MLHARLRGALAILALVVASLVREPRADAVGDPSLIWETHKTEHFHVHSHKRLRPIALRVAEICETVHTRLRDPMGWSPKEITNVVVTDETDFANGSATALPYNTMRLFVTAPDDLSPLNDYDDWLLELITHEYTHILHTDHITGLPAIYNAIVGKQYSPNQMQPRWLLEGLAVLLESKYTSGGRNRSSIFDMYLRADVLEDNVAPIDQITHSPRRWPQGNLWYLYGSHFLEYIDAVYGFDAIRSVLADYSDEIIPFGINRAIHRTTGKTYIELYQGWIRWMQARYAAQKAGVIQRGLREGRRMTNLGQEAFHPRYVPGPLDKGVDRRIAYFRNDGHTIGGLWLVDAKNDQYASAGLLARTSGPSTPAFLPDGSYVYDSVEVSKMRIYYYWDLFRHAAGEKAVEAVQGKRLTYGLRASEPAVSADGHHVAYVVNKAGTSFLYTSELDGHDGTPFSPPKRIVAGAQFEQVYTPRWSPDGRKIAYSAWTTGGYRDVKIVDVETGAITEIMHDRALDTGPVFSADGKKLFFSSDRTGIANIYAWDLETKVLRQVTNVINGAFQPETHPDGKHLCYVGYGHGGYDLFEIDLDESKWLDALDYVDLRGPRPPAERKLKITPTPYNPWPTLRPYAWDFELRPDAFGEAITMTTRGGDVVGWHAFSLALTASFVKGFSGLDLTYVFRNMPFDTRVRGYRYIAPRGGYRFSDQQPSWIEQSNGVEVGISGPIGTAFAAQSIALSYAFSHFRALDGFPQDTIDPYTRVNIYPQTGWLGTVHIGWSWSNLQRFLWSVSTERGLAVSFGLDVARPELAGQWSVTVASYNSLAYLPNPLFRHHVLALHAQGGTSMGDFARRGAFALGGFSDIPLPDALRNLLIQPSIALRGYKPGARFGDSYQLFNFEYRFPILNVDRGVQTLPVFFHRFYGNLFMDYGDASFEKLDILRMKVGIGAEILADAAFGYFQGLTLRIGIARGTSEGGATQTYTVLSNLF